MIRSLLLSMTALLFLSPAAYAETPSKASPKAKEGEQHLSGMSIVGNDEAPKSLAIVPWKGSKLGDALNALKALGDGRDPVDKEVFMRALAYYELRAGDVEATSSVPAAPQP